MGAELLPAPEREQLVRSMERLVWSRASAAATVPAFVIGALLVPGFQFIQPGIRPATALWLIAPALPYYVACLAHWRHRARRLFGAIDDGLAGRSSGAELREVVLSMPFTTARRSALYWCALSVVIVPWQIAMSSFALDGRWRLGVAGALGTCAAEAALLTYLVVERTIGPLTSVVMRGAASVGARRMSMLRRLLVAFTVGIAVPLTVENVWILISVDADRLASIPRYALVFNIVLVGIGLTSTIYAARSITDPLRGVRRALRDVEQGDLGTEVDVTESGEVGALQGGFNAMVAGLRERERMRDLFGRHVGADVVAQALRSEPTLDGEVREITAMFVDVIGSTPLAQSRPPTDVVAALNRFFDTVVRCVTAESGSINQFQGDGAVCIFGAPMHQPDHARRALRCTKALALELAQLEGLEAAIGVSSGLAVAGNVGTLDRYAYTVIGDPVNEASRLCDAAKDVPSGVLVSSVTLELAGAEAEGWKSAGLYPLRGRAEPTRAFGLT